MTIRLAPILHATAFLLSSFPAVAQDNFLRTLADSTLSLTRQQVIYDPAYFGIAYPNGDVPPDRGVCTDVIIRAFRKTGIDLQKAVYEDMVANFSQYPRAWRQKQPDKNIDHRRVLNLMTFFTRHGKKLPITANAADYQPGDIVTWNLGGGVNHIGIVVNKKSDGGERFMIVHNIGSGQVLADFLFSYPITGHFQFGS